jgi:hypothetical protein
MRYKDLELPTLLDMLTLFSKNYTELLAHRHIHDEEFMRCRKIIEELQKIIREMMNEKDAKGYQDAIV